MDITARINTEYAVRTLLVGLMLFAFALWFVYDGAVGYPSNNRQFAAVSAEVLAQNATAGELLQEGADGVRPIDRPYQARGWKTSKKLVSVLEELKKHAPPPKAGEEEKWREWSRKATADRLAQGLHPEGDIRTQFGMALIFGPAGLFILAGLIRKFPKRFTAAADGLHGFLPQPIPYAAIVEINKLKWDAKGIARITVNLNGVTHRLVLDDWHFRGMAEVLAEIEKHCGIHPVTPAEPAAEAPGKTGAA